MIKVVKKIAVRVILLALLLVGLNYFYLYVQYPHDLEMYSGKYVDMLAEAEDNDILFFGDCSDVYKEEDDTAPSVSGFLDSIFPCQVATISENGFHPGTYVDLLKVLHHRGIKDKTIVMTLNLRGFAPKIVFDETYDPVLKHEMTLLRTDRPALVNRASMLTPIITEEERKELRTKIDYSWDNDALQHTVQYPFTRYFWNIYPNAENRKLSLQDIGQSYIHDFAFLLDDDYEFVQIRTEQIKEFWQLADKMNCTLYFYIPPINDKEIYSYGGDELIRLLHENLIWINSNYPYVIDHSLLFGGSKFVGPYASSHYTEEGRRQMAIELSKYLHE